MTKNVTLLNERLLSRLIVGALSEHEQRVLMSRLLRCDPQLRNESRLLLEPFKVFDQDLALEYAAVLERYPDAPAEVIARHRRVILDRAFARTPDLERQISELTFEDVVQLTEAAHNLFSWSMAELLLARAERPDADIHQARTSLYLALAVIDMVELLGAADRTLPFPDVIEDVRARIQQATVKLRDRPDSWP